MAPFTHCVLCSYICLEMLINDGVSSLCAQVSLREHGGSLGDGEPGCVLWYHHVLHLQGLWPSQQRRRGGSGPGRSAGFTSLSASTLTSLTALTFTSLTTLMLIHWYYMHVCMYLCVCVCNSVRVCVWKLFPYLVMDILSAYPGVPGLFVAAAYSGTLRWEKNSNQQPQKHFLQIYL